MKINDIFVVVRVAAVALYYSLGPNDRIARTPKIRIQLQPRRIGETPSSHTLIHLYIGVCLPSIVAACILILNIIIIVCCACIRVCSLNRFESAASHSKPEAAGFICQAHRSLRRN